jgi:alkylation response protein AidB-like acyl-CoA dehydrogenase
MNFALTDDQRAIQDAARAFAEAELAPHSARWDEEKHFPVDVMKQAAEMASAASIPERNTAAWRSAGSRRR